MATLKEIQDCELEILKTVADICERHNIPYFLAAGTFLGAVRHKGFIPWDDDIDIYVMNSDMKRLKKICKKEFPAKLFWQDYKTDKGTPYLMTKIRNVNTYMPQAEKTSTNQGIWLDVFPLIYAAKEKHFKKQVYYISRYQYYLANQIKITKTHYSSLQSMLFRIARELLVYRPFTVYYYSKSICTGSKKSGKLLALDVSFFGKITEEMIAVAKRKSYPVEMFQQVQSYPFEQYSFDGVADYDKYLTMLFGKDYMTPKQYSHFTDYSNVQVE